MLKIVTANSFKIVLKKRSFRNRENLPYKTTADSVLYMSTKRKCNNSSPSTCQRGILLPSEPNIPEGPKYEKNINTIKPGLLIEDGESIRPFVKKCLFAMMRPICSKCLPPPPPPPPSQKKKKKNVRFRQNIYFLI